MKFSPFWIVAIAPSVVGVVIISAFAIPNFRQAAEMRADSLNVSNATDQYMVQRDEFERLEAEIATLRKQRTDSGHVMRSDVNESKLVPSLTRPIDGTEVLDQSIRIGDRETMTARPAGLALDRRAIEMQMTGSFEAVFKTVRTAEDESGTTRVRSIDIHRSGPQVQAIVGIDEYFYTLEGKQ